MTELLISFLTSLISCLLIIRFKHLHGHLTSDSDLSGPQKFHAIPVPRVGGIALATGLIAAILLKLITKQDATMVMILMICAIPTFAIGLTEDLTKSISVRLRLLVTASSGLISIIVLQTQISTLGTPFLNWLFLIPFFGAAFSIFAITGLANAYNIVDGFNGLAAMLGLIALSAIAYLSYDLGDTTLLTLSLVMIGSLLGFFVCNYPSGSIFLGDGGAYLLGFWIAVLSIMLIAKHPEISPWFAVLINAYPITETLFSIYRRKVHHSKSLGQPDGLHFHTLIYRRFLSKRGNNKVIIRNSETAPYIAIVSLFFTIGSAFWKESNAVMIQLYLLYVTLYTLAYIQMINFRVQKKSIK